jgi:hypothetical protein
MDRAIEIEQVSLAAVGYFNSWVLEIYENASWVAPIVSDLLGTAGNAFAFSMELQWSWLTLIAARADKRSESLLPVAAPGSTVARGSASLAQTSAEVLERSMDIAIGAEFEAAGSTVENSSQPQSGQRARAHSAG